MLIGVQELWQVVRPTEGFDFHRPIDVEFIALDSKSCVVSGQGLDMGEVKHIPKNTGVTIQGGGEYLNYEL